MKHLFVLLFLISHVAWATDPCSSPTVITPSYNSGNGQTYTGRTNGASSYSGSCVAHTGPEDVYQWTPSNSGTATIQTCGSSYDTVLYVRSGTCASGTQVACNDDSCIASNGARIASSISPSVTAGTTYYIFVDGYGNAKGNYNLKVVPPSPGGSTVALGSCPASAAVGTSFTVTVTANVGTNVLGSYGLTVTYDPNVLHVTQIQGASSGSFTATPIQNNGDWSSGSSMFSMYQTSSMIAPTGTVPLARVSFGVNGGSGGRPSIGLIARVLGTTSGVEIPNVVTSGCP